MRAIKLRIFGGVENFEPAEIENPVLLEKSVKIRVKAAAFNPIDYQMRRGGTESKLLKSNILGRELAGIVTEVDAAAKNFKIGDEVFSYVGNLGSNGTYAEEIVVPEELVALKPSNLTFAQSAAIPLVGLTAFQAVQRCAVGDNEKVFVAGGAGGVGSMIVRLLKLRGVERIFTTAGSDESRKQLISLGLADENIIDYRDSRVIENLLEAADGAIDVCLDCVGGEMSRVSAEALKINGLYADITFLVTGEARELLFDKGATIVNISNFAYGLDGKRENLVYYGSSLDFLKRQIETGALAASPIEIVGDLAVATVQKAHQMLEQNLTRGKKLVMEIN